MATGGKYSTRVDAGSETYFEFACCPCAKELRHVQAVKGCMDCGQNFCATCLKHHTRFEGMREHRIVENDAITSVSLPNPMGECSDHPGRDVEMFCGTHDLVCCAICIALSHRSCKDVDFVTNVAKGIKSSAEFKKVKCNIKQVGLRLKNLKLERQQDFEILEEEKTQNLGDIDAARDTMVNHIDLMIRKAKAEVYGKYSKLESKINAEVVELDDSITALQTDEEHLEASEEDSEAQVFFYVKKGNDDKTKGNQLLNDIEKSVGKDKINFSLDTKNVDYILNLNCIGNIEEIPSIYQAKLFVEFDVKVRSDRKVCDITGFCPQVDGTLIITDFSNEKIKKLNNEYKVISHNGLPGTPGGVCSTSNTEVAVAITNSGMIQYVSVATLKLLTSFNIDGQCRDVAFSNGELLVSIDQPEPKVCTYSQAGDILRTLVTNTPQQVLLDRPRNILLGHDKNTIYVANADLGILKMDKQGKQDLLLCHTQLKWAWGLCQLDSVNFLVSFSNSNNIVQFNSCGQMVQILLSQNARLDHPHALCYIRDNSRILISLMKKDKIKVFKLSKK